MFFARSIKFLLLGRYSYGCLSTLSHFHICSVFLSNPVYVNLITLKFSYENREVLLTESELEDPVGYDCMKQIIHVKEVKFVEQVRCYKTMKEVCVLDLFMRWFLKMMPCNSVFNSFLIF